MIELTKIYYSIGAYLNEQFKSTDKVMVISNNNIIIFNGSVIECLDSLRVMGFYNEKIINQETDEKNKTKIKIDVRY